MASLYAVILFSLIVEIFSQATEGPCQQKKITVDKSLSFFYNYNNVSAQDCTIVMYGMEDSAIALTLLAVDFADDEQISVYNAYGNTIRKYQGGIGSYLVWPPSAVYLQIKTNSQSNASLRIDIVPRDLTVTSTERVNISGAEPLIIDTTNWKPQTRYEYVSDTHVVLSTAVYPIGYTSSDWIDMFLYEGTGENAKLVGSVYNTINNNNFVSSGNSLTIYCSFHTVNPGRIIINDYKNVEQFSQIQTRWSYQESSKSSNLLIDATKGPSVLTVANYGDVIDMFIRDISFTDDEGSIILYNGAPTDRPQPHMLATYNSSNADGQLAQQIFSEMTTFVLNKGRAGIRLEMYDSDTNWSTARVGRSGFITSPHYQTVSEIRDHLKAAFAPERSYSMYTFKFNLEHASSDPTANYSLSVDKGKRVYSGSLTKGAKDSISVTGQSVDIDIFTGKQKDTGILVRFDISKHSSTINGRFITALLLVPMQYLLA